MLKISHNSVDWSVGPLVRASAPGPFHTSNAVMSMALY